MVGGILLAMNFSQFLTLACRSALKCVKQENVLKGHASSYMRNGLRNINMKEREPVKWFLRVLALTLVENLLKFGEKYRDERSLLNVIFIVLLLKYGS